SSLPLPMTPPHHPRPCPLPPRHPPPPDRPSFPTRRSSDLRPALHVERAVVVERRANGGAARAPALLEAARVVDRRRTPEVAQEAGDRHRTRLNSSHEGSPFAVS